MSLREDIENILTDLKEGQVSLGEASTDINKLIDSIESEFDDILKHLKDESVANLNEAVCALEIAERISKELY